MQARQSKAWQNHLSSRSCFGESVYGYWCTYLAVVGFMQRRDWPRENSRIGSAKDLRKQYEEDVLGSCSKLSSFISAVVH